MDELKTSNIVSELNLILLNIPSNLSLIEKIRWVYIKTGKLFSYNYKVSDNIEYAYKKTNFSSINKYQTCVQISEIFNIMLQYIDPNIRANVIDRKLDIRGVQNIHDMNHKANEVILPTGERYLLDLTLDLFLIQSGCKTKHFCYETDSSSTYDILSLNEIKELDKKLGIINEIYTDDDITETRVILRNYNYDNMSKEEIIKFKLSKINSLMKQFNGYQEGIQYINKLISEILETDYKEFNLHYKDEIVACFVINFEGIDKWIIYSSKLGLVETTFDNIINMLKNGWITKSNTLNNMMKNKMK